MKRKQLRIEDFLKKKKIAPSKYEIVIPKLIHKITNIQVKFKPILADWELVIGEKDIRKVLFYRRDQITFKILSDKMVEHEFTPELFEIKENIEKVTEKKFDYLIIYKMEGKGGMKPKDFHCFLKPDYMLVIGEDRIVKLREKNTKRIEIKVKHGDLYNIQKAGNIEFKVEKTNFDIVEGTYFLFFGSIMNKTF